MRAAPQMQDLPTIDGRRVRFALTADAFAEAILDQTANDGLADVPWVAYLMAHLVATRTALPKSAAPLFGVEAPILQSTNALAYAIQVCAAQRGAEPLSSVAARFGPRAGIWAYLTLVAGCPALPAGEDADAPARTPPNLPTLVLLGRYDANAPAAPALALAAAEPGSVRLVVLRAGSHDVGSPCAARLTTAFLQAPHAPLDTACADEPLEFTAN